MIDAINPDKSAHLPHWQAIREALQDYLGEQLFPQNSLESRRLTPWLASANLYHLTLVPRHFPFTRQTLRHFLVKQSPYVHLEARALTTLNLGLKDTPLASTVPQFVALLDEHSTLITDFQPDASSLAAAFLRANLPSGYFVDGVPILRYAHDLGHWLGRFQALLHRGEEGRVALPDDIEERLHELDILGRHRTSRFLKAFDQASADAGCLPLVMSHGDFAPRNALITPQGLHIIDWEMTPDTSQPHLFDVHHLLAILSKFRPSFPGRPPFGPQAAKTFLHAYQQASPLSQETLDRSWRVSRLLALVLLLSRQVRTSRRHQGYSFLTGRIAHIQTLARELRHEIDLH